MIYTVKQVTFAFEQDTCSTLLSDQAGNVSDRCQLMLYLNVLG